MNEFVKTESGAVTVDWVVLTAALVGLGLAAMAVVSGGVKDLSDDVDTQLRQGGIIRTAFSGIGSMEFYFYEPSDVADMQGNLRAMGDEELLQHLGTRTNASSADLASYETYEAALQGGTLHMFGDPIALYDDANWDVDRPLDGNTVAVSATDFQVARKSFEEMAIIEDEINQRGLSLD